ncbi:hypothetical protein [Flavobacterium luteolum]|uniref:hypothetical protein n=1 Tax=Flavobacterium luteolum TaxID=3003259 RepID=UPI00248E7FEB|nr:hypothetical protein [Flavobacterium luteolum]
MKNNEQGEEQTIKLAEDMEKSFSYVNDFSKATNLRLYILEHSLHVEELVSTALGYILEIDWKKSKSFGYSSVSLSFNQKALIIQDLKGLDKNDIEKLSCFMAIRNKFAHVKSVNTFEDFFNSGKNGSDVKKSLIKFYPIENSIIDDDLKFKISFFRLFLDICTFLLSKVLKHEYERGRKDFSKEYFSSILTELGNIEVGEEILKRALTRTKVNLNID